MSEALQEAISQYENLERDAYYSKITKKLNETDKSFILVYLSSNKHLDKNAFEYKANRIFIDLENKTKNWKIIMELLSVLNSKFRK